MSTKKDADVRLFQEILKLVQQLERSLKEGEIKTLKALVPTLSGMDVGGRSVEDAEQQLRQLLPGNSTECERLIQLTAGYRQLKKERSDLKEKRAEA